MKVIDTEHVKAEVPGMAGVRGTTIQWLIDGETAPNFAMRRFVITKGGVIPLHDHPYEHEMYVLSGEGTAITPEGERTVHPGDSIYVPPDEPHGWRNDGEGPFVFLCLIPLDGKVRR